MLVQVAKEAPCAMGKSQQTWQDSMWHRSRGEGQKLGQQYSGFGLRDPLGSTLGKLPLAFLF